MGDREAALCILTGMLLRCALWRRLELGCPGADGGAGGPGNCEAEPWGGLLTPEAEDDELCVPAFDLMALMGGTSGNMALVGGGAPEPAGPSINERVLPLFLGFARQCSPVLRQQALINLGLILERSAENRQRFVGARGWAPAFLDLIYPRRQPVIAQGGPEGPRLWTALPSVATWFIRPRAISLSEGSGGGSSVFDHLNQWPGEEDSIAKPMVEELSGLFILGSKLLCGLVRHAQTQKDGWRLVVEILAALEHWEFPAVTEGERSSSADVKETGEVPVTYSTDQQRHSPTTMAKAVLDAAGEVIRLAIVGTNRWDGVAAVGCGGKHVQLQVVRDNLGGLLAACYVFSARRISRRPEGSGQSSDDVIWDEGMEAVLDLLLSIFSVSGSPPRGTVSRKALCADASAARRKRNIIGPWIWIQGVWFLCLSRLMRSEISEKCIQTCCLILSGIYPWSEKDAPASEDVAARAGFTIQRLIQLSQSTLQNSLEKGSASKCDGPKVFMIAISDNLRDEETNGLFSPESHEESILSPRVDTVCVESNNEDLYLQDKCETLLHTSSSNNGKPQNVPFLEQDTAEILAKSVLCIVKQTRWLNSFSRLGLKKKINAMIKSPMDILHTDNESWQKASQLLGLDESFSPHFHAEQDDETLLLKTISDLDFQSELVPEECISIFNGRDASQSNVTTFYNEADLLCEELRTQENERLKAGSQAADFQIIAAEHCWDRIQERHCHKHAVWPRFDRHGLVCPKDHDDRPFRQDPSETGFRLRRRLQRNPRWAVVRGQQAQPEQPEVKTSFAEIGHSMTENSLSIMIQAVSQNTTLGFPPSESCSIQAESNLVQQPDQTVNCYELSLQVETQTLCQEPWKVCCNCQTSSSVQNPIAPISPDACPQYSEPESPAASTSSEPPCADITFGAGFDPADEQRSGAVSVSQLAHSDSGISHSSPSNTGSNLDGSRWPGNECHTFESTEKSVDSEEETDAIDNNSDFRCLTDKERARCRGSVWDLGDVLIARPGTQQAVTKIEHPLDDQEDMASFSAEMIRPSGVHCGMLRVSKAHIHFSSESTDIESPATVEVEIPSKWEAPVPVGPELGSRKQWLISQILELHGRRYVLRPTALEILFSDGQSVFFNFPQGFDSARRVYQRLVSLVGSQIRYHYLDDPDKALQKYKFTENWVAGRISNFEYLMQLNSFAGRTYNDLEQYFVMPWVLRDYGTATLDLSNPESYRDFAFPIAAQSSDRRAQFRARYNGWSDPEIPKFNFGSHYSSTAIVLWYLLRLEPYTGLALEFQGGQFDCPDRMFRSIAEACSGTRMGMNDVKELIPEFFFLPEFLVNADNLDLGCTQSRGRVNDVELPPWARGSPQEFVRIHRQALESEYVSANLHHWIDLIFGYKQRGPAAESAVNVYYHLTYEGAVDLENIEDPEMRRAAEAQIRNFGQTPRQLFNKPHPQRRQAAEIQRPAFFARADIHGDIFCSTTDLQTQQCTSATAGAQDENSETGNSVSLGVQNNEGSDECLQQSSPVVCGLESCEQRGKVACWDNEQSGQQGPLPPEKLFGPLVRNRVWSSSPMGNSASESVNSPRTPRVLGSAKRFDVGQSVLECCGLVWMAACDGFVTAVRGDGVLLAWTVESGDRGAPSLLQIDLIVVETQELIPEQERAGGSLRGDRGKLRQGLFSSILTFRNREVTDGCDVKVGPQGMWATYEHEDDSYGLWSQRFALLERAGARVVLSAGHPDGTVHSYSIGAGQVSLMQVVTMHRDVVTCLAVVADTRGGGKLLVTGSADTTIRVWGLGPGARGRQRLRRSSIRRWSQQPLPSRPVRTLHGHSGAVTCLAADADLDVVVSGGVDGKCIIHRLSQGDILRVITPSIAAPGAIRGLALTKNGEAVWIQGKNGPLYAVDINGNATGLSEPQDKDQICALTHSNDGEILFSAGSAGTIVARSARTLTAGGNLPVETVGQDGIAVTTQQSVMCMALSACGNYLFAGLADGSIDAFSSNRSPEQGPWLLGRLLRVQRGPRGSVLFLPPASPSASSPNPPSPFLLSSTSTSPPKSSRLPSRSSFNGLLEMKTKTTKLEGDALAKTEIQLPVSPLARENLPSLQETAESSGSVTENQTSKDSIMVEKDRLIEQPLPAAESDDDESESLLSDYRNSRQSDADIPRSTKRRPFAAILA